jgi:hypothetical protein
MSALPIYGRRATSPRKRQRSLFGLGVVCNRGLLIREHYKMIQLSTAANDFRRPQPLPRHALPCMHARVIGFSVASLSRIVRVCGACAK